ncbi:MAG: hypothetical protein JXA25_15835 [Anaerolineales bacterium]|nr:hypothetical protein [Anaerolineales bacterium]
MSPTVITPRQRVRTALKHEEPDRVPTALGGGPYGMVDDLYLRLVDYLGLGSPVPPFRSGHSISYMDDRLLERLGTDLRYCWPGQLPNSPILPGTEKNSFYDSYGQIWKRALPYYYAGKGLLQQTSNIEDIDRLIQWPDLSDPCWMAGVAERAHQLHEQNQYFITMRMIASHGPFQTACDLRGTENFLMDMVLNQEFAEALLYRITTLLVNLLRLAMQSSGDYFDMIELPGDDYAGNTSLIISPAMFRQFLKPCLARMVNVIREHNPEIRIMLHSDGAVTDLLSDVVELGIDVIHPLEPLPATNLEAVKKEYGNKISFLGGIDISHAMPGSREDVSAEVRNRISQLAAGGGYILAPSNHLQADVPAGNVLTLFDKAREFGTYPIQEKEAR